MKRIIITESQYQKLEKLLIETPFNKLLQNDKLKKDDIIRITHRGEIKNNFKVLKNTSGEIFMDNVDSGSININYRYLMNITSLDGDDLEIRRIHKVKEADKLTNPSSWKIIKITDISTIEIIRDGKLIDSVDPLTTGFDKQQKQLNDKNEIPNTGERDNTIEEKLTRILDYLKEGTTLVLKFPNVKLVFCCTQKIGNQFAFEIKKNPSIPQLNSWSNYELNFKSFENIKNDENIFSSHKDMIKTTDNGKTFALKFKAWNVGKGEDVWIDHIVNISVGKPCDELDIKDEKPDTDAEDYIDPKELAKIIASDKNLQKAFYSQPTFWELLQAELTGKKAQGSGIITAGNMVRNYREKIVDEKLNAKFLKDRKVTYSISETIYLDYFKNTKVEKLELKSDTQYEAKVSSFEYDSDYRTLRGIKNGVTIIINIKEAEDKFDRYTCDIGTEYFVNEEKITKFKYDLSIRLYKSPGYLGKTKKIN